MKVKLIQPGLLLSLSFLLFSAQFASAFPAVIRDTFRFPLPSTLNREVHLATAIRSLQNRHANAQNTHVSVRQGADLDSSANQPVKSVTLDFCQQDSDCVDPLTCQSIAPDSEDISTRVPCIDDSIECFCFPAKVVTCTASDDCPERELCASLGNLDPFCMSIVIQGYQRDQFKHIDPPRPDTSTSHGTNLYPCDSNKDCLGTRECIFLLGPLNAELKCRVPKKQPCFCAPTENSKCTKHEQCDAGEICGKNSKNNKNCISADTVATISDLSPVDGRKTKPPPSKKPASSPKPTISAAFTPSPSPSKQPPRTPPSSSPKASQSTDAETPESTPAPSASSRPALASQPPSTLGPSPTPVVLETPEEVQESVCVDATALQHLSPEQLVFEKHAYARVLCDTNMSCATKGHMVVFKGSSMMMKTYCQVAGCEEMAMHVNSPKRARGLRISSKTKGLEYTAFAARHETRAEETFLRTAIRAGF